MKQILICGLVSGLLSLTGCDSGKLKVAEAENATLNDSLRTVLSMQDSLLVLVNDISEGMDRIKDMEQILNTTNLTTETSVKRDQVKHDMVLIQQTLEQRRLRLAELENKLKQSNQNNTVLQRTIQNLKAEISNQEATINNLRADLAAAKIEISELNTRVDSLNATVSDERNAKERAEQEAVAVADELNLCYYAVGTKSELKKSGIVESGFLRKTKVLQGDFEQSYFKRADKRTLSEIPTHAKNAKVISNNPADSYEIVDIDGSAVIRITNPAKFWALSNYLVVQVN
ncbi:MAG: hypothetical protein K2M98_00940 [Muribaculum sp.]|nr:hypothetical protein [Muribaculum sp.]